MKTPNQYWKPFSASRKDCAQRAIELLCPQIEGPPPDIEGAIKALQYCDDVDTVDYDAEEDAIHRHNLQVNQA